MRTTMLFRMDQPVGIVHKMIYNLPVELFESDITTFLDPAMGKGDYLVMVAQRLREYGHSKENILSRLYGFECNELYVQNCLNRTPLRGAHIKVKTYEEVLKWNPNMIIDVVIGNPPYNDGETTSKGRSDARRSKDVYIHTKFFEAALGMSKHVMFICPIQEWFQGRGSKLQKTLTAGRLRSFEKISAPLAKKIFNVTTGDLGIFHATKENNNAISVTIDGINFGVQQTGNQLLLPAGSPEWVELLQKLSQHTSVNTRMNVSTGPANNNVIEGGAGADNYVRTIGNASEPLQLLHVDNLTNSNSPMYKTKSKQYVMDADFDKPRLGINQAGTRQQISAMKLIPAGIHTSYSIQTFTCETEEEVKILMSYFNTKFVKAIVHTTHFSSANGKTTFKYVPLVDLTRPWSDEELYEHFGLTKKEIALIEGTFK